MFRVYKCALFGQTLDTRNLTNSIWLKWDNITLWPWKLVGVWGERRCSDLGVLTLGFLWTLRSLLLCIQQLFLLRWSINTLSLQPTRYFTFSFWSFTSLLTHSFSSLKFRFPLSSLSFLFLPPTPTVVPDQYSINLYSPVFNLFLVVVQVYNVITPSGALCGMNMETLIGLIFLRSGWMFMVEVDISIFPAAVKVDHTDAFWSSETEM